jgi:hypothetical protein
MSRPTAILGAASLLTLVSACGSGTTTPTSVSPPEVTDTFSGTLAAGGSAFDTFTIAATGPITVTVVSLSPQTTITMGVGIGTPSAGSCVVAQSQENVKVGVPLQGTFDPGSYCVLLYDLGNISGSDAYTITVQHP